MKIEYGIIKNRERQELILGKEWETFLNLEDKLQYTTRSIDDIEKGIILYESEFNADSISIGQLASKRWLIEIVEDLQDKKRVDNLGTIFLLCGWYGILALLMFRSSLKIDKIRSFDIDDSSWKIADFINKEYLKDNWRFKAIKEDIFNINFSEHSWQMWSNTKNRLCYPITDMPDTIINTSCEHTTNEWFEKIPDKKLVILQSTDFYDGDGHIKCVDNISDFKLLYNFTEILYEGVLEVEKYNRFMLIGVK